MRVSLSSSNYPENRAIVTQKTFPEPAFFNALAQALNVAPVVFTSSTNKIFF
jgi:uncharacterized membrane protein YebE (DUF533 family)